MLMMYQQQRLLDEEDQEEEEEEEDDNDRELELALATELEEEEQEEEQEEEEEDEVDEEDEEEAATEGGDEEAESQADDDATSLKTSASPNPSLAPRLSILSSASAPSSSATTPTVFHSIAADVRKRGGCEKHGDGCPTESFHHQPLVTTKVLHLSTSNQGGQKSPLPTSLPPLTPLHPPNPPSHLLSLSLCFPLSSDAVHQRILTGLTSPASASSASKSFLFPPVASPSRDKENQSLPSTPHRSVSHSTFQLSPSSAFTPVGSPSTSSLSKRRKTVHASPPASLGRAFHTMEAEVGAAGSGLTTSIGRKGEPVSRGRQSRSRSGGKRMPR